MCSEALLLVSLKREAYRNFARTVSLQIEPTTLETLRAAIAAGYFSDVWLAPAASRLIYEVQDAVNDEAYEVLYPSVVRGDSGFKL